jgi:pyruvate dehydrogenase E1 component alpha subunit
VPVLFICENNLYAMGTALSRSEAQIDLTKKAASYGVPTGHINGMNVLAVHDAARQAIDFVRREQSPFFLELHTYRFRAHSMFDAELYRDKVEVERWKQHGPIHTFTDKLKAARMMSEADFERIDREANEEVEAAVAFAEGGTWEPVEQLATDVYTPH